MVNYNKTLYEFHGYIDSAFLMYLLNGLKAVGKVQNELGKEIVIEAENPTLTGAYNSGYVSGLAFSKKQINKNFIDPVRDRIIEKLAKDCDEEVVDLVKDILCNFEENQIDSRVVVEDIWELVTNHLKNKMC